MMIILCIYYAARLSKSVITLAVGRIFWKMQGRDWDRSAAASNNRLELPIPIPLGTLHQSNPKDVVSW